MRGRRVSYAWRLMEPPAEYWNHNVAYHPLVLRALPPDCATALDVGSGDGLLARRLAARAGHVSGIDSSARMVDTARQLSGGIPNVSFIEGDFLTYDFRADELPGGGFGFVCSVATVHHMRFGPAIARMAALLRPGGRLIVIGLARKGTPLDWAFDALGVPVHQAHRLLHRSLENPYAPPVLDPEMSWAQVRDEALRLLPGARFRRRALWRYSVVWTRP